MWLCLVRAVRQLRYGLNVGATSYRPELHYMRGPGPKWRAKHGRPGAKKPPAAPVAPVASPELKDAGESRA